MEKTFDHKVDYVYSMLHFIKMFSKLLIKRRMGTSLMSGRSGSRILSE